MHIRSWVSGLALCTVLCVAACGGEQASSEGGAGAAGANGGGGSGANGAGTPAGGSGAGTTTTGPLAECNDAVHAGKITYYNEADGSGACSFDPTPDDLMVGAMNAPEYAGSAACGTCVLVTGPNGDTIGVRIVDLCPGCDTGHIDLSPSAFAKLADLSLGVVDVTWRYAPCDHQGPIQYKFKEGSNQWWTAVQVRRHTNEVATFEYDKDGVWVPVQRVEYNYFVEDQGMGPGPYKFRVTDIYGNAVEDEGIAFQEGGVVDGKGQFPQCSGE